MDTTSPNGCVCMFVCACLFDVVSLFDCLACLINYLLVRLFLECTRVPLFVFFLFD